MNRILTTVLVAAGIATAAHAAPERAGQDAEVLRLEDQFAQALSRRDEATFRRLLADGFVYSENDSTMTRDALIRELVSGSDKVEAAHNEEMQVHRFGTVAIVTGWLVVSGKGTGGAFERRYRFTDTWLHRDAAWQLVAAHDFLAPQAVR